MFDPNGTYGTSFWNKIQRCFMPVDGCEYVSMWEERKEQVVRNVLTLTQPRTHTPTHMAC